MMNNLIAYEYIEISETNLQVCTGLTNGEIMKTIGHLPVIFKLPVLQESSTIGLLWATLL